RHTRFPSPLCGRGWLARRESEREPGEGAVFCNSPHPPRFRSAPSPTRGEGQAEFAALAVVACRRVPCLGGATMRLNMIARLFAALLVTAFFAAPASAAQCGGNFNAFLNQMARDAQAAGVS